MLRQELQQFISAVLICLFLVGDGSPQRMSVISNQSFKVFSGLIFNFFIEFAFILIPKSLTFFLDIELPSHDPFCDYRLLFKDQMYGVEIKSLVSF